MENTFQKASVMQFADKVEYAHGGVVSKQVLKNDAGNITLFSFDALVQVLDGSVEIRIDGKPFLLKTGEA